MGWLDYFVGGVSQYLGITGPLSFWGLFGANTPEELLADIRPVRPTLGPDVTNGTGEVKLGFLGLTGIILTVAAAAPVGYALYNARKRPKKRVKDLSQDGTYLALEGASNRATSLLAGLLPAFALPIAYIGVEELEQKHIITGALGDRVQTLMAAGVVAPAVGNIIGSVVGGLTRTAGHR